MNKEKETLYLASSNLKLSVNSAASEISLVWKNKTLTKDNGLFSITEFSDGSRYYSNKVDFKLIEKSGSAIRLLLKWKNIPLEEYWDIFLKDKDTITWKVSIKPLQELDIRQHEIGVNLSPDYKRWLTSCDKGNFPPITRESQEWIDAKLINPFVKSVGFIKPSLFSSYLPSIIWDFNQSQKTTRVVLRNSPISDSLRGLAIIIAYKDIFKFKHPPESQDIFKVDIRLVSRAKLAAQLRSFRREDKKRYDSYNKDNIPRENHPAFFSYLFKRLRHHWDNQGMLYAFYRAALYIVYFLKTQDILGLLFNELRMTRMPKEKRSETYILRKGKMKLVVIPYRTVIDIYWDDKKITQNLGLVTILTERSFMPRRLYSNQAFWRIDKLEQNNIDISLLFLKSSIIQEWHIALEEEGVLTWNVSIIPQRQIVLNEQEIGIILRKNYTHWINSYEEGVFKEVSPQEKEWKDERIYNLASKVIGTKSYHGDRSFNNAILFDFNQVKEDTRPVIRNGSYDANLRLLLVQVYPQQANLLIRAGQGYELFSGKIRLISQERALEDSLSIYRKTSYRHRLPYYVETEKGGVKSINSNLRALEVVLVNLPWEKDGKRGVRAGSRWPHIRSREESTYLPFPFFLAYTASLFLEQGINVRIIDALAENMGSEDFINLINNIQPRLLIAEVSTPSLENDLQILKRIDKRNPQIAICGLDFSIRNPDFLKRHSFIDFVMVGEYEYTALDLFKALRNPEELSKVLGIIYKDNGNIKITGPRPALENLDLIPWPLREQLPMEQYMDAPGNIPTPSVQMLASRGCPFRCTFCAWPQIMYNNNSYRMRQAELIVDEMEYLAKERKFKSIYFDDDTFNISKPNVLKICKEIKKRSLNIPWAIMARADTMDEEMLLEMKEAGLHAVKYGVESGEQELLNKIGKNMDLKKAERMIRFTQSLGIKTHLTFTFGLPDETKDTIKRTIELATSLSSDTIQFSILTPYPGTEYYKQLDAKGHIVSKDLADYDGANKSVIRTEYLLPSDLEQAKEEAWRAWKRHKRKRYRLINMPFNRELRLAFKNNLKNKGLWFTCLKTLRYILNTN